ncbi:transposable element Tcb2 transposase [Trichonephila clavipes]|nr:transposable element Tcb2 transposase [Trichonephila clavipes]
MMMPVSKRTEQRSLHRMGCGRSRPTRVPLLNALHQAARLAWVRVHRDWSVANWKRVTWSDESRFRLYNAYGRLRKWRQAQETMDPASRLELYKDNCTSHKSRLATGWLYKHYSAFSAINWPRRSPELNPIEHLWNVLGQGIKGHHTAPTNLTELGIALANIWQVIPVEHFQKLVESMPRRLARGGPTHYYVGIPNSVALQCSINFL